MPADGKRMVGGNSSVLISLSRILYTRSPKQIMRFYAPAVVHEIHQKYDKCCKSKQNNKTIELLISKEGFNVINFRKAIPVETFHITQDTLVLLKNGTANLSLELLPANTTRPGVTWTTANTSLATVDALGKVTAKNVLGLTYVYAKSVDGIHKDTCVVEVISIITGLFQPLQDNASLQVYPNPYKDGELTVKMNVQGNHVITIVEITGKTVYKTQSNASTINISDLSLNKGIYFVKMYSYNLVGNAKLVVN